MTNETDVKWMRRALEVASRAERLSPPNPAVGALIVRDDRLLAQGFTQRAGGPHAEVMALRDAFEKGVDTEGATLYVTLEPCPMCSGAIINSRLKRVVYGARDPKAGCCGSVTDLFAMPFNHHPVVEQGLRAEEAQELLQVFFKDLRARLAARPKWKPPV